ncbi:MAG: hypothetical protein LH606_21100 [Cytophagaceae bacterium]|nr:hypothetical protein [Cytophagaceae bacterium]
MQTLLVEILNEKALPLLRNLENLDVIRLVPSQKSKRRLAEELWGSISPELAEDLHRQLEEMRNEWERDI